MGEEWRSFDGRVRTARIDCPGGCTGLGGLKAAVSLQTLDNDAPLFVFAGGGTGGHKKTNDVTSTEWGRQIIFVGMGLVVLLLVAMTAPTVLASEWARRAVPPIFFTLVTLGLIVALIPLLGYEQRGSNRWLRLAYGGLHFTFQPSELAKLAMVALVASILSERSGHPRLFKKTFVPAALVIGVCMGLVGLEDFGTGVLLAGVGAVMVLAAGCRLRHLGLISNAAGTSVFHRIRRCW